MHNSEPTRLVLNEPTAARHIGRSRSYLRQQRMRGRGPAYIRVGRGISYLVADLDAWLHRHRVETERPQPAA